MLIKDLLGEVHLKIVYFGPGMSGKTTNLQQIHAAIRDPNKGKLTSVRTREDRTLYFDFVQFKTEKICGLIPKFNMYTVPGQSYYAATRKLVLAGVDGVVFVADSQKTMMQENIDSFNDLQRFLKEMEKSFENIPTILQCNKQDLDSALKPEIIKSELSANGIICYPAVAIRRIGIFETLKTIINEVGRVIVS